ncbi:MAG: tRNA lysidine(34) synthetase TilS [Planctomycetota bacterium]
MLPLPEGRLLLACSGGPDSLGLAALLAGEDPLLAYVDHQLRGVRASRVERRVVRTAADRLGLDLVRARVRPTAGNEAAARRARYDVLERLARRHGCVAIALAHTADDRAETVLFNLLRGTGLRGLAAPRPRQVVNGMLRVRPALDERRSVLRTAAADLEPLEDRSNRDTRFARARTRGLLLPGLAESLGGDPVELLCGLADRAEALRSELEARARELATAAGRRALLAEGPATFPYLVEALRGAGPPLTAAGYEGLRAFLEAGRGDRAHVTPGGDSWRREGRDGLRVNRSPGRPPAAAPTADR